VFFLLNINDLLNIIADLFKLVLFVDDTSIIIVNPKSLKIKKKMNSVIEKTNGWFILYSSLNF
jgi:hypothetical protein